MATKEEEIVAYKAWVSKYCGEARQDSTDMWRHLMDKHDKHSVTVGCNGGMFVRTNP